MLTKFTRKRLFVFIQQSGIVEEFSHFDSANDFDINPNKWTDKQSVEEMPTGKIFLPFFILLLFLQKCLFFIFLWEMFTSNMSNIRCQTKGVITQVGKAFLRFENRFKRKKLFCFHFRLLIISGLCWSSSYTFISLWEGNEEDLLFSITLHSIITVML